MSVNIHKLAVTLVCNQAAVLCLLLVVDAFSSVLIDRKWTVFGANMTQVFGENSTEKTTPDITVCALLASRSPPANLACHKSSRCVFASVYLPRVGGEQTEGFTCLYSQVCSHEGALVRENENVTVADPDRPCTRTQTCSMEGLVFNERMPPPLTTCTAPFTQHSFGCMYDSSFIGTYCEARQYCQELGADLASPETEQDTADMMAYYKTKHAGQKAYHYVGLYQVNGVWRWPANQREAGSPKTGNWDRSQPDGGENAIVMYPATGGMYKLGDVPGTTAYKVLCHVWTTVLVLEP